LLEVLEVLVLAAVVAVQVDIVVLYQENLRVVVQAQNPL
jgi:hypothetical protein